MSDRALTRTCAVAGGGAPPPRDDPSSETPDRRRDAECNVFFRAHRGNVASPTAGATTAPRA